MEPEMTYENGVLRAEGIFDAPPAEVFDAWIATSKVEQWWGCANTTNVESVVEPRVGGKYQHKMTINNVGEHCANSTITEYNPPHALAFEEHSEYTGGTMRIRVTFEEMGGRTKLTLVHEGLSDAIAVHVKPGWAAGLSKLAKFLGREAAAA